MEPEYGCPQPWEEMSDGRAADGASEGDQATMPRLLLIRRCSIVRWRLGCPLKAAA